MNHPHHLTVTEIDGERSIDWTHPDDCPDGERCDIRRRARRVRSEVFWELVDGRPVGAYRLGRFGFHGLLLVDEDGGVLPDVVEALSPAAQAARDVTFDVVRQLAEAICEDTERVVELARVIQHGQAVEQAEDASNRAVNTIIDDYLGTMRAYTGPIDRLLGDAA